MPRARDHKGQELPVAKRRERTGIHLHHRARRCHHVRRMQVGMIRVPPGCVQPLQLAQKAVQPHCVHQVDQPAPLQQKAKDAPQRTTARPLLQLEHVERRPIKDVYVVNHLENYPGRREKPLENLGRETASHEGALASSRSSRACLVTPWYAGTWDRDDLEKRLLLKVSSRDPETLSV